MIMQIRLLYLFSDGFSRNQLGFNGDEEAEEGSFTQAADGVISTFTAQTALLTVSQQHWRSGHLKRPINLNRSQSISFTEINQTIKFKRDVFSQPIRFILEHT